MKRDLRKAEEDEKLKDKANNRYQWKKLQKQPYNGVTTIPVKGKPEEDQVGSTLPVIKDVTKQYGPTYSNFYSANIFRKSELSGATKRNHLASSNRFHCRDRQQVYR